LLLAWVPVALPHAEIAADVLESQDSPEQNERQGDSVIASAKRMECASDMGTLSTRSGFRRLQTQGSLAKSPKKG
jgi:hypothetical protein